MGRPAPTSKSPSWRSRLIESFRHATDRTARRLSSLRPADGVANKWAERIGTGLVVCGLLLAAILGVPELVERATASGSTLSRESANGAAGPAVRFADDVDWLAPAERARIEISIASELAGRSAFDQDALAAAAEAASRTGWFDGSARLLRTGLDEVLVLTPLRVPRAVVRSRGRDHLIDIDGILLPMSWREQTAPETLPVFLGVREPVPDQPGSRWEGGSITIGFAVLDALLDRPWSGQIRAIDLHGVDRGAPIQLRTAGGGTIVWGTTDPVSVGEVPIPTRLAYLDRLHRRAGSIEPPSGKAWDVRLDYLATRTSTSGSGESLVSAER
jgi:hypothetical protein